jgi:hypothetical protein
MAGSYPAFYLSAFLPLKVMKGLFKTKQPLVSSRKILIVVQFTVAAVLILATLVIYRQIRHAQDRETGYNKDQLIYMFLDGDINKNFELIKQDLINSETAISVTKTSAPMTQGWSNTTGVEWQGKDPNAKLIFDMYFTDANWTKTVGATIIEGRDIDTYTYPTDSTAALINESALKIMNLEHPIGEIIGAWGEKHIVGVVKDFILHSPYRPIVPMVICGPESGWYSTMHIKLNGHNSTAKNLSQAEQIFKQYNPAYPFEYQFIDEEYAYKFREEQRLGTLATWFAGLTIFISCLGLFGLSAYIAARRRKEIGIRKVFGASIKDVVTLLSHEFITLVFIALIIAIPVSWLVMSRWLQNYAYRTNLPWYLFVAVSALTIGIAVLTVCGQALKVAMADPIKSISSSE